VEKDSLIKAIEENSSQLKSQINELESETNSNKAAIKGLVSCTNIVMIALFVVKVFLKTFLEKTHQMVLLSE